MTTAEKHAVMNGGIGIEWKKNGMRVQTKIDPAEGVPTRPIEEIVVNSTSTMKACLRSKTNVLTSKSNKDVVALFSAGR